MTPSPPPSPALAAFTAGTSALHLPPAELTALRHLLPSRTLSRCTLGDLLHRLHLPDPGLADALFELADLSSAGAVRAPDLLATYATLRRLATTPTADTDAAALWLAFLSAGGSSGALSFAQWARWAGEVGLGVGGVDCLPCEEATADLRRRWRAARGRVRALFVSDAAVLPFDRFAAVMRAGDAGLLEGLRAVGFVLVHAVVDFADVPVEKPTWLGDVDSCYLSQFMSFAISSATAKAEAEAATRMGTSVGDDVADAASPIVEDAEAEAVLGLEADVSSSGAGEAEEPNGTAVEPDEPLRMSSPFPDVENTENGRRPAQKVKKGGSKGGSTGRPRVSFGALNNPPSNKEPADHDSSRKAALNIVRRTRDMTTGASPFHIDFSSLKLGERIGSGAYGEVYRGTFLMSPVAVKVFHVNVAQCAGSGSGMHGKQDDEDPSQMSRMVSMSALQRFASVNSQAKYKNFVREVEMMSVVRHPNLVLYMGACGDPVTPLCIVSELFTGGSLYEYLHEDERFRPPATTCVNFGLNIARGMFYLHSSQPSILHRDLKSRNVLLSGRRGRDGVPHVVICDFGLCQLFGEDGQSGGAGGAMGTASYMAPDVINGGKYEAADDVYSYGILLHEIFTGCVPYVGFRAMQVMFRVAAERLRPQSAWDEVIPERVRELIEDCWAAERARRPTFDKIIERLTEIERSPP